MSEQPHLNWQPNNQDTTLLSEFIYYLEKNKDLSFDDYEQLHSWSINQAEEFWSSFAKYSNINFTTAPITTLNKADHIMNDEWFSGASLNFAHHLLQRQDNQAAIIYRDETGKRMEMSHQELYSSVANLSGSLKEMGVKKGDVVAAVMTNRPETVVAMLATSSIGAIWTSCSPDFGTEGVIDRIGQVKPKILFTTDGYQYGGKHFDLTENILTLEKKLDSLNKIILIHEKESKEIGQLVNTINYEECLLEEHNLEFVSLPFNHPLFIMYSSGTTGKPKCIIHGAGGTLLQHLKEHRLHTNIRKNDRVFFFTTCGWMMWNWLISALASEATIILYEGSPLYPDTNHLWSIAEEEKINVFGISPGYLSSLMNQEHKPKNYNNLSAINTILSTGSPLLMDHFEYINNSVKDDVQISSISGGTDIISCFALGNANQPVYKGEIQSIGLGMAVKVFDDLGKEVKKDEKGELVCTQSFPSMPIGFFGDPKKEKYKDTYFDKYNNVWAHGDYATITKNNGLIIFGRSDTTLNAGGVRIGTAEIYRQLEKFPTILQSVVIDEIDGNNSFVSLFVVLKEGVFLTQDLINKIKKELKLKASPRHVPKKITSVPDIPKTRSGKISELSVKAAINGNVIKNIEALDNPHSLDFYRKIRKQN
ncbi:MAG: acetoacetate--CoA ligase [Gammaproteobacteria bacterium]|nr:acetoacetate--CoA ligase [Gammaproteobacteria bacterium]